MPDDIGRNLGTLSDYVQQNQAVNSRGLIEQEKLAFNRRKLAKGGGNMPAAMKLAQEYTRLVEAGDQKGADTLAEFAKTRDKGLYTDAEGILRAQVGLAESLGTIERGKQSGKEQAKSAYQPAREENIAELKAGVTARTAPGIAFDKTQAVLQAQSGGSLGGDTPVSEATLARDKEAAVFKQKGSQSLPKIKRSMMALQDKNEFLDDKIDSIAGRANGFTTGFGGALFDSIPGSPAYDLKLDTETLLANAGFDRLQEMRDNSPTGGALGQVSERELALLQSAAQNLQSSQSKEQFLSNLTAFKEQRALSMQRVEEAYQEDLQRFGGEAMQGIGLKGQAEQNFNQRKDKVRLKYDPMTGEFE